MYCLRNLAQPTVCHNCRQPVPAGLAGFYYNHALCGSCFRECDPQLASLLTAAELTETVLQVPPADRPQLCGGCHQPIRAWITGRQGHDLFCRCCFRDLDPHLTSVLILEKAVRTLVEDRAPSSQYLELARHYVDARSRLDG